MDENRAVNDRLTGLNTNMLQAQNRLRELEPFAGLITDMKANRIFNTNDANQWITNLRRVAENNPVVPDPPLGRMNIPVPANGII